VKALIILIRRNFLAPLGAFFGTALGYVAGGQAIWMLVIPPCLLLFSIILDLCLSKAFGKPIVPPR